MSLDTDPTTLIRRNDSPAPARPRAKSTDRSETILLVEDDPHAREFMREVLRRHGYQVLTADSEAQALWVWERQAQKIDLLLTDVMIPNCTTGIQLAKRLQQQKPTLQVICVSGFSRDIGSGETNFVTRFPFLQKPCSPRVLLETVHRCLETPGEPGQPRA